MQLDNKEDFKGREDVYALLLDLEKSVMDKNSLKTGVILTKLKLLKITFYTKQDVNIQ